MVKWLVISVFAAVMVGFMVLDAAPRAGLACVRIADVIAIAGRCR